MKILGIQKVDYVNKNGVHVTGTTLHVGTPFDTDKGVGMNVSTLYVSAKTGIDVSKLALGMDIEAYCDSSPYHNLVDVRVIRNS